MKTQRIFILSIVLALLAPVTSMQAQTNKLGYVNVQELLVSMPSYKDAEKKLQAFAKELQDTYMAMQEEYQKKAAKYQEMTQDPNQNKVLMDNLLAELVDLEKRMQQLEVKSDDEIGKKQDELLAPIQEQVLTAIKQVSVENGYTYIFDSSALLYYPESDNVLPLVKKKLGIQ